MYLSHKHIFEHILHTPTVSPILCSHIEGVPSLRSYHDWWPSRLALLGWNQPNKEAMYELSAFTISPAQPHMLLHSSRFCNSSDCATFAANCRMGTVEKQEQLNSPKSNATTLSSTVSFIRPSQNTLLKQGNRQEKTAVTPKKEQNSCNPTAKHHG